MTKNLNYQKYHGYKPADKRAAVIQLSRSQAISVAANVRVLAKGKSQVELAKEIGCTAQELCNLNNRAMLSEELMAKIKKWAAKHLPRGSK